MKKVIIPIVILITLTISVQLNAQYSVLYEGEEFNVQFTYNNDGKAIEIVMKSADQKTWTKFQIVEFQPLTDGYRYVTKNPVGNIINMEFVNNDELLTVIIVGLEDKILLKKKESYSYDHRIFK